MEARDGITTHRYAGISLTHTDQPQRNRVNGVSMERFLKQCKQADFWDSVFTSLDNPFYPNASGWARTLLYLLHQLVIHQFEPLDLRESELMVLQWRGFYSSRSEERRVGKEC